MPEYEKILDVVGDEKLQLPLKENEKDYIATLEELSNHRNKMTCIRMFTKVFNWSGIITIEGPVFSERKTCRNMRECCVFEIN